MTRRRTPTRTPGRTGLPEDFKVSTGDYLVGLLFLGICAALWLAVVAVAVGAVIP